IEYGLRPRRAAWHIDIHRDYFVDSLHHAVSIKYPPAGSTSPDGHYPARFGHLQVNLPKYRPHLLGNGAHYHQQVGLAWRETRPLGTKPGDIIIRSHRSHELDTA